MKEIIEQHSVPAVIGKSLAVRETILEKMEMLKAQEAKIKKAKTIIQALWDKEEEKLLSYHKEHGDFEINGYSVKTSVSWSTVIKDESKLPGACFKVKKDVVKAKVKELILEGKISKEVAFQQKSTSLKINVEYPFLNSDQVNGLQKALEDKKHKSNVEAMKKEAEKTKGVKTETVEEEFDPFVGDDDFQL